MKHKKGKDEISCLLSIVFEKYESETGNLIIRNTNRKNYESVARKLSEISNRLPTTAEALQHDYFSADQKNINLEYPFRKYDITASQVKDASLGLVNNPRSFLTEACYIYIYGVGKKGFEKNPSDDRLFVNDDEKVDTKTDSVKYEELELLVASLSKEKEQLQNTASINIKKLRKPFLLSVLFLAAVLIYTSYQWITTRNKWEAIGRDMNILSYKPTKAQIEDLEGIWLCYTGSPQARSSEPNRFHLIVLNVIEIKFKNGYFTYNRFGAAFNHTGYAQFEAPELVSIHSHVKNNSENIESPRHSLMQLDSGSGFMPTISASWNFDVGDKNKIIGIREVYKKLGKDGSIEEVTNTIENASCKCKILRWIQDKKIVQTFQLKNKPLESFQVPILKNLLDERSIILREPQDGLILTNDSLAMKK